MVKVKKQMLHSVLGLWEWIAAGSCKQDRGCFGPHVIFSVLLGFLDCLHPPSIAASRVESGPKRRWSEQSCRIRHQNTVMFVVVRQQYPSTKHCHATTPALRQQFGIGSEPSVLHTWFGSTAERQQIDFVAVVLINLKDTLPVLLLGTSTHLS